MASKTPGLFITGTDTGVGKTYVAALIAADLHARGITVGVYKPAASGCRWENGTLVSDDAVQLWKAAGQPGELSRVCPHQFAAPLAPHLAARAAGKELSFDSLLEHLDYWRGQSEFVLVEGAGGLLSPLGDEDYVADLAAAVGYPLLVVADNSIGVIHRTLSTLVVAATYCDELPVAGVVLNEPRDVSDDPSHLSNLAELRLRAVPPVLGLVQWQCGFAERIDWMSLVDAA